MPKSKKSSEKQKQNYKSYQAENRWERNKTRRLARHVQHNPNDFEAAKALETANFNYTRNQFKRAKPMKYPCRLNQLPPDERETIREQFQRILDSGELRVRPRNA